MLHHRLRSQLEPWAVPVLALDTLLPALAQHKDMVLSCNFVILARGTAGFSRDTLRFRGRWLCPDDGLEDRLDEEEDTAATIVWPVGQLSDVHVKDLGEEEGAVLLFSLRNSLHLQLSFDPAPFDSVAVLAKASAVIVRPALGAVEAQPSQPPSKQPVAPSIAQPAKQAPSVAQPAKQAPSVAQPAKQAPSVAQPAKQPISAQPTAKQPIALPVQQEKRRSPMHRRYFRQAPRENSGGGGGGGDPASREEAWERHRKRVQLLEVQVKMDVQRIYDAFHAEQLASYGQYQQEAQLNDSRHHDHNDDDDDDDDDDVVLPSECTICYATEEDRVLEPCGHRLCAGCASRLQGNICPWDRVLITRIANLSK